VLSAELGPIFGVDLVAMESCGCSMAVSGVWRAVPASVLIYIRQVYFALLLIASATGSSGGIYT